MGLFVKRDGAEYEITESGDLVFIDYDINYDILATSLGEDPTEEIKRLQEWEKNPIWSFLEYTLMNSEYNADKNTAIKITKSWISTIAEESRISRPFEGRNTSDILSKLSSLVKNKDIDGLKNEDQKIGAWSSFFLQSSWKRSQAKYNEYDSPRFGLLSAISLAIRAYKNILVTLNAWSTVISVSLSEMVEVWLRYIGNSRIRKSDFAEDGVLVNMKPEDRLPFKRFLVGAAVAELTREE